MSVHGPSRLRLEYCSKAEKPAVGVAREGALVRSPKVCLAPPWTWRLPPISSSTGVPSLRTTMLPGRMS